MINKVSDELIAMFGLGIDQTLLKCYFLEKWDDMFKYVEN